MPYADLTDVRCYYELLGTGDPVLLVPGLGATCAMWSGVADELAKSFSLILLDNRGLGRSIAKRPPQSLSDFAVDLVELLAFLQLERAHVIGLSLGGIIAQQLALDHPSRIDRLVLISCTNRFGPYLLEVAKLLAQALRHFPPELYRRTVELLGTSPGYLDAHADEIEERIKMACSQEVPRKALARQLRCLGCNDIADPQHYRIIAPTLVISGALDTLIPARYGRKMADEIPGSEFVSLPDCGHNPLIEQPENVVPRVIEFLSRDRVSMNQEDNELEFAMEAMSNWMR